MENKHPVSVLQELMAQQHRMLPIYEMADISEASQPKFRCTVKADGIVGVAEASQKQTAKKEAAMHALSQLQQTKIAYCGTNNSFPAAISYNAVGKLNEYTAQKRLPYPSYNEYGLNTEGEFVIRCTVIDNVSEGSASTKKAAKQLAAHYMLNSLDGKNLNKVEQSKSLPLGSEFDEQHDKVIFEKFRELSVSMKTKNIQEVSNEKSKIDLYKIKVQDTPFQTTEDMVEELKRYDISYNVDIIHRNPFVLLLRFENKDNTTVVETGASYQETHRKLIHKALTVLSVLND